MHNNELTTNGVDSLGKPTEEEYAKSNESMSYLSRCIRLSRERQDSLLDDLCSEREREKNYVALYEQHREVVRKYQIYVDIENGIN